MGQGAGVCVLHSCRPISVGQGGGDLTAAGHLRVRTCLAVSSPLLAHFGRLAAAKPLSHGKGVLEPWPTLPCRLPKPLDDDQSSNRHSWLSQPLTTRPAANARTPAPPQVNPDDDTAAPRRRGKQLTEHELWESRQLIASGVLDVRE